MLLGRFSAFLVTSRDQNSLGMWLLKPDALPIPHASTTHEYKLNKPLRYKGHCSIGCKVFVKTLLLSVGWSFRPVPQCLQDTRRPHLLFLPPQCPTRSRLWTAIFSSVQNELSGGGEG